MVTGLTSGLGAAKIAFAVYFSLQNYNYTVIIKPHLAKLIFLNYIPLDINQYLYICMSPCCV